MNKPVLSKIIVNSRKFDGTIRRSWTCNLLEQTASSLIFVGQFDKKVLHTELGEIQRGTISYEYYWLERWYNIFCFYEPDGSFRNYYCNINMPPKFANCVLDYIDLDIDVVVWPDGKLDILDEAEFEQNAEKFGYPESVRAKAVFALAEVLDLIRSQKLPHPVEIVQQNR